MQGFGDPTEQIPRSLFAWHRLAVFVSSPVFRSIALLPILGYLILYGDAFQGWFELSSIGEDLFLTGDQRLRSLYYGGIAMVVSMGGFALRCPSVVKRYPSNWEYISTEASMEDYRKVENALCDLAFGDTPRGVDVDREVGAIDGMQQHSAGGGIGLQLLLDHYSSISPRTMSATSEVDADIMLETMLDLRRCWTDSIKNVQFRYECRDLLEAHYLNATYSKFFSRYLVGVTGTVGVVLVSIPAIETLIRVVLLDFIN